MLDERLRQDGMSQAITDIGGVPFFVEVKSIVNEPASATIATARSRRCSGPLVMRQDISRQMDGLRTMQLKSAGISVLGMTVLLLAIFFFMKITVVNRLRRVAVTTDEISQEIRLFSSREKAWDELGLLAACVNTMAENMRSMMQEVSRAWTHWPLPRPSCPRCRTQWPRFPVTIRSGLMPWPARPRK